MRQFDSIVTPKQSAARDTRGIVDPAEMFRHVTFEREPAGESLDGIIDWFWAVRWDFPDGIEHRQQVLNLPGGHISIGTVDDRGVPLDPACGRVYGVLSKVSHRRLLGSGWTVAAKTTTGGLGVLLDRPARSAAGRELDLSTIGGLVSHSQSSRPTGTSQALIDDVIAAGSIGDRIALLRNALGAALATRDPAAIAEARMVADVARLAETDRSVRRVEQLAAAAGVSVRTLQRLFSHHVGVSPAWVIRRWRIIEAADAARTGADRSDADHGAAFAGWATLAAELGYADQAHLVRDFRKHLGVTPGEYLNRQR